MPTYTATAFRWSTFFYGNVYTSSLTVTLDDDDAEMNWFGSGDPNQLATTSDGLHTNAVVNGGSFLNIRMDYDSNGTQDAIESIPFFQVGGDWYFIPPPGSPFGIGSTMLGNSGGWVDSGQGWDYVDVTCFAQHTLIETADGARPVQDLNEGDLILTRDNGLQPLRWRGCTQSAAQGKLAPIVVTQGTLDNTRDLVVSPQHAILLSDWRAELLFGQSDVLIRAIDLLAHDGVYRRSGGTLAYHHLLFDAHQLVLSEGQWSESLYPGEMTLANSTPAARDEITTLFPDLDSYGPKAATCVRAFEATVLAA